MVIVYVMIFFLNREKKTKGIYALADILSFKNFVTEYHIIRYRNKSVNSFQSIPTFMTKKNITHTSQN